ALAILDSGSASLLSRRGSSISSQYPAVAAELARRLGGQLVLDGEIVALDEDARPSFHRLAHRMHLSNPEDIRRADASIPVVYYVFDLLYLDGYDLRGTPLEERRALLDQLFDPSPRLRLLECFPEVGEIAYEAVLDHGLEGIV